LLPICAEQPLTAALQEFGAHYSDAFVRRFLAQIGLAQSGMKDADAEALNSLLKWMQTSRVSWDQTLFDLFGMNDARMKRSPQAAQYESAEFAPLRAALENLEFVRPERLQHPYFAQELPVSLVIEEVEGLWAPIAERDDWSAFEAKLAAIAQLREAMDL
jgi:serine/tyrosine/threonine adenylyltransferase